VQGICGFCIDHVHELALHVLGDVCRHSVNLVEVSDPTCSVRCFPMNHKLAVDLAHFAKEAVSRPLA
jgi:hypothetical protein